jgi:hypothetical protein
MSIESWHTTGPRLPAERKDFAAVPLAYVSRHLVFPNSRPPKLTGVGRMRQVGHRPASAGTSVRVRRVHSA